MHGDTKGILVNSCKPRRKKRTTIAKARQLSDRRLFKGVCPKKKKKRGKRAKKDKVEEGKSCASFSANYKEWQRGDAENSKSKGQVASDANRDFDLNAKVTFAKQYIYLLRCCSFTFDQHIFCHKKI